MPRTPSVREDAAEMGTPTLLVFIAVLVIAAWGVVTLVQNVVDLQSKSAVSAKEAASDASTGLRVLAVFAVRNDTSHDLWDLHALTELPPGSVPLDLSRMSARFASGATEIRYAHDAAALPNGSAAIARFNATWILGDG